VYGFADIESPELTGCVQTLTFTADYKLRSTTATWSPPTAVDNVDGVVNVTKLSGPEQGDIIEDEVDATYQATDSSGNPTDVCSIKLKVNGTSVRILIILCSIKYSFIITLHI